MRSYEIEIYNKNCTIAKLVFDLEILANGNELSNHQNTAVRN